jgi:hypothetical protein
VADKQPIGADLAEAFRDVISFFPGWSPTSHGREISINGRAYAIDAVCGLVMSFNDRLPSDVVDELFAIASEPERQLKVRLAAERSYATGATLLLAVMQRRKSEHQLLENERRR